MTKSKMTQLSATGLSCSSDESLLAEMPERHCFIVLQSDGQRKLWQVISISNCFVDAVYVLQLPNIGLMSVIINMVESHLLLQTMSQDWARSSYWPTNPQDSYKHWQSCTIAYSSLWQSLYYLLRSWAIYYFVLYGNIIMIKSDVSQVKAHVSLSFALCCFSSTQYYSES